MISEATKQFILQHRFDDVRQLALSSRSFPDIDLKAAIVQIAGRQAIKSKIPSWYENDSILYPLHLPIEQCSSEQTARYKAGITSGNTFVDLTGGFGVDCSFMAQRFQEATYIERQQELCSIAEHNFQTLGLEQVRIVCGTSEEYLLQMQPVDCIFLDPARRSAKGKKIAAISDCEPDVEKLKDLLLQKASTILIKLSPMLDISLALRSLPETKEVHVVSVENECKELLFLLENKPVSDPEIICINLSRKGKKPVFSFTREEERTNEVHYTSQLKKYLYEPHVSLMKAGAYKTVSVRYGLTKLHPDSHLYTSESLIPGAPCRIFEIELVSSFNKKDLKSALANVPQANLSIRNFPMETADLLKKLKLKDGGDKFIFATTLNDHKKVLIICHRIHSPHPTE